MGTEIKHVFISHYHEDEEEIDALKDLLKDDYDVRNYSVTSEKFNNANNEEYIKCILRPLIDVCSIFICLIGPNTHESNWVNWEIEHAMRKGKKIIGIYTLGAKDEDMPKALKDFADAVVTWRREKIIAAIQGEPSFEFSDGSQWKQGTGNRTIC